LRVCESAVPFQLLASLESPVAGLTYDSGVSLLSEISHSKFGNLACIDWPANQFRHRLKADFRAGRIRFSSGASFLH
jgi:hypothetical protein